MFSKICLSAAIVLTNCAAALQEDGIGVPDGKKSLGGSGEMIQLELADESGMLRGIEIHGSRYGMPQAPQENFLIYVLNREMTEITATKMAPYSLFERGEEKWVTVEFNEPIEFPEGSWIVLDFRAGRSKGVYVSFDADSKTGRSRIGLPGLEAQIPDFEGDWMIRPLASR